MKKYTIDLTATHGSPTFMSHDWLGYPSINRECIFDSLEICKKSLDYHMADISIIPIFIEHYPITHIIDKFIDLSKIEFIELEDEEPTGVRHSAHHVVENRFTEVFNRFILHNCKNENSIAYGLVYDIDGIYWLVNSKIKPTVSHYSVPNDNIFYGHCTNDDDYMILSLTYGEQYLHKTTASEVKNLISTNFPNFKEIY